MLHDATILRDTDMPPPPPSMVPPAPDDPEEEDPEAPPVPRGKDAPLRLVAR